jgi:hypothetical protein
MKQARIFCACYLFAMGRWTSEKSGFDVLRSLAEKAFAKHETRKRIWSDDMEAWGYFGDSSNLVIVL